MKVAIVGAGLSGAVLASELSRAGHAVEVFERHAHIAGHCFTYRDISGVLVHAYGPHIFHTANDRVWNYVQQFDTFMPYVQRTKAVVDRRVYTLPINLHTINQFFGKNFSPIQARIFIQGKTARNFIENPCNFEEQALSMVGSELYEAFFRGYTRKQWGREPSELPASILKRLPLRFDYNDNYFDHPHQGIPRDGYTDVVGQMLDHRGISVNLATPWSRNLQYDHVFYTGPLDAWFDYAHGRLGYRTLDFTMVRSIGDAQGAAVINYCDESVPFTRVTEHKHFAPWEQHEQTVTYTEVSRECTPDDEPYYPIRLATEREMLGRYLTLAGHERNVTFVGRLATYRYLDMDVTVGEALAVADKFLGRA